MSSVLFFPVEFGSATIGDTCASIGVKVDRAHLEVHVADDELNGKRVGLQLYLGEHQPRQKKLFASEKVEHIELTCDVKSLRLSPKQIGFRISGDLQSMDVDQLKALVKRTGTLVVQSSETISTDKPSKPKIYDHPDTGPILEHTDERSRVRAFPIYELANFGVSDKSCKALAKGFQTFGEACDYITGHGATWMQEAKIPEATGKAMIKALKKCGAMD